MNGVEWSCSAPQRAETVEVHRGRVREPGFRTCVRRGAESESRRRGESIELTVVMRGGTVKHTRVVLRGFSWQAGFGTKGSRTGRDSGCRREK